MSETISVLIPREKIEERTKEIAAQINRDYKDRSIHIVCVLKDARTLIGARNHDICVNTMGSVSLAKAGSGDVLAGTIGALLAKGLSCYDAACAGAYLHGKAGKKAEDDSGEDYVMALELADLIGKTYRKIKEK